MTMSSLPAASACSGLGLLLGAAEARQFGELHRPRREAVGEIVEVLLGQQRGRHQHRHLVAAHHRHEGGAQRDLGLAEADVAAHQPVHRLARLHVGHHGGDGGGLVGRFLVAEAFGEGLVVVQRKLERVAFARGAQRVQVQEFGGGVARCLHGAAARLFPLVGAELVQRRRAFAGTAVARDQVQVGDRHVELVALGVLELQELGVAVAEVHVDQAEILADAVLCVHDRVAGLELGQVAQQVVDLRRAGLARATGLRRDRIELGFGDDGEPAVGRDETFCERPVRKQDVRGRLHAVRPALAQLRIEAVLGEIFVQGFAPPGRRRDDQHRSLEGVDKALQLGDRVRFAAVDRNRRQRMRQAFAGLLDIEPAVALGQAEEGVGRQEQFCRRQQRTVLVARQQAVTPLRVSPEGLAGGVERAVGDDSGCAWAGSRTVSPSRRRTAAGSTRCRPARGRC